MLLNTTSRHRTMAGNGVHLTLLWERQEVETTELYRLCICRCRQHFKTGYAQRSSNMCKNYLLKNYSRHRKFLNNI